MRSRVPVIKWAAVSIVLLAMVVASRCSPSAPRSNRSAGVSDVAIAAQKTYVAPGDLDEYYMFASGGHSGQIFVFGLPSMRHLVTIPVFSPYPATGYGFDDESKAMLGKDYTWGDDAPPGALRDRRRLRRPVALHQRDERTDRADRSPRFQDQADPGPGRERVTATTARRSSRRTPSTP